MFAHRMLSKISSVRCGSFDRSFPGASMVAEDRLDVLAANCTPHSRFDINSFTRETCRRSQVSMSTKHRSIAHRLSLDWDL